MTPLLVVQERRRLYRESMTACLKRLLGAFDVAEGVADAEGLLRLAESRHLDHAVIEVGAVPWDVATLVGSLRCHNPSVQVIGLSASPRYSAVEGAHILSRIAGPDQVAEMVSPGRTREAPFVLTSKASSASSPLSGQQLRVLALLSLGMTVAEVAVRLSLSERAVTKAKVAIFSKLGVQSQAQAVASALAAGWLGPAAASSLVVTGETGVTRATYRTPDLRAHRYRSDLPKVVTVHDDRFLAPGLLEALQGQAEVVGDTAYGAAALQLAQMLTPDVVVAGELLGDGLIDHFLPHLVRAGTRVLLVVEAVHGERALELLAAGLAGVCSADEGLADLARAVLDAASGWAVVPPPLVASIVTEWRSGRRHGGPVATGERLTMREMEVLNAMADGLSTKAAARLLGVAVKTVESHRTRVFAKLGVRSQAQLVAARAGRLPELPGTIGAP